jgi:hypothetical protein
MGKEKQHFNTPLVLDASSPIIQAGIAKEKGWRKIAYSEKPALNGVFETISTLLRDLKIKISQVDAVFFCAGPGSTLGLRLTLALIKSMQWEKQSGLSLFSYNALDLAARMSPQKITFIQAPFRMGWRFVRSKEENSSFGKKQILNTEDALKNYPDSLHLPDPRKKNPGIDPSKILGYEIKKVNGLTDLIPVSEEKKELEVYNPKPPKFKKWHPELTFLKP